MNIETIKALFEEMRKSGVLLFKYTAPDATTYKVVMHGAESTDATGVVVETNDNQMGFDATRTSIYESNSLKLKDFN